MNILLIQEAGRHGKNSHMRESLSMARAFHNLGHSGSVWGKGYDVDLNSEPHPCWDHYDVVINLENYDSGWVPNLSKVKARKFLWSIDGHVKGMDSYYEEFYRGGYEKILQSTHELVGLDSIWFPNCYDDEFIHPIVEGRGEYDVGFCGNINNRGDMLNSLQTNFSFKKDIMVIGEDMVKAINSYKVHVNRAISCDINYRNFETVGCAVPLVTNYDPMLGALGFVSGKNCMLYKTEEEMISHVRLLLEEEDYRLMLAIKGFEQVAAKNTYKVRCREFLEMLKK